MLKCLIYLNGQKLYKEEQALTRLSVTYIIQISGSNAGCHMNHH